MQPHSFSETTSLPRSIVCTHSCRNPREFKGCHSCCWNSQGQPAALCQSMANTRDKPWQLISPFPSTRHCGFTPMIPPRLMRYPKPHSMVTPITSLLADNKKFQKSSGISPKWINKGAKAVDYTEPGPAVLTRFWFLCQPSTTWELPDWTTLTA